MANAKHLATPSGNNAQIVFLAPLLKWKIMPLTRAPPTFWLNNQHIQGSLEKCALFLHIAIARSFRGSILQCRNLSV